MYHTVLKPTYKAVQTSLLLTMGVITKALWLGCMHPVRRSHTVCPYRRSHPACKLLPSRGCSWLLTLEAGLTLPPNSLKSAVLTSWTG